MRLAIVGAGVIGRTHIAAIRRSDDVRLCGIVEPSTEAERLAHQFECTQYRDLDALVADKPDGVIIATPNNLHVEVGIKMLEAGIPVLIEKPIAETAASGRRLVEVSQRTGVLGLVGHHRRHNPIVKAMKAIVTSGQFGGLVMGSLSCSLFKPNSYFDAAWRSEPGNGGPLLINLIHEIDLLRHLFGPISKVTAISSNAERGFAVEDTAGVIFAFANGGIVSAAISDAAVGPWAWDLVAAENPERFPTHPVSSHTFCGTSAGISLPDLTLWQHGGPRDWTEELKTQVLKKKSFDAYDAQIRHFRNVISGSEAPLVSMSDGWQNLRVVEGIQQSAREEQTVLFDVSSEISTSASTNMEVRN